MTIAASQEGNSIVIRINDDGRGIPVDKIKAKALAKGLISEAELATMEHREVLNLIFLPGFSTAEQVTDVSGRGVGMDVVRTNIRKINGSVDLESEPGKGSQIIIKLPLTIAIIQALMVEVEQSIFAIPLSTVIEAVRISRSDIKTINGREVLHLRDRVLPLIRLAQEFDIPTNPTANGSMSWWPPWETAGSGSSWTSCVPRKKSSSSPFGIISKPSKASPAPRSPAKARSSSSSTPPNWSRTPAPGIPMGYAV